MSAANDVEVARANVLDERGLNADVAAAGAHQLSRASRGHFDFNRTGRYHRPASGPAQISRRLMFDGYPPWVIETFNRANRLIIDWRRHAGALVRRDGLSLETVPGMQKHIVVGVAVEKILFQ